MSASSVRLKSDLNALDQAIERAGSALGCAFSSSEEFEAAVIAEFVGNRRRVAHMRMWLGVTAGACVVLLAVLAI